MGVIQRLRDLNSVRLATILSIPRPLTTTFQKILDVRLGPGAAVLSRHVQSLHLNFAFKSTDGHLGPRRFWRIYLPKLKYHNPSVSMTVQRNTNQAGPATMKIVFSEEIERPPIRVDNGASGGLEENERIETIDMKYKEESEILAEFLKITEGEQVSATEEEQQQVQESALKLAEMEQDKKRSRLDFESKARDKRLFHQARQGIGGNV